jgi:hypothetical protein
VWWVELAVIDADAAITDDGVRGAAASPDEVAAAVGRAIGLPETLGASPLARLQGALRDKQALVVLDNCEHLVEACARVVDAMLASCPAVTVLASSREPLATAVETVWRVPSLSLPPDEYSTPTDLADSDAVRLFVERVGHARPHFELTADNAAVVAEICRRLDGIPLALSWQRRVPVQCPWNGSRRSSTSASICSPAARGPPCAGSKRCWRRSRGATTCSTATSAWPSDASLPSSAASALTP